MNNLIYILIALTLSACTGSIDTNKQDKKALVGLNSASKKIINKELPKVSTHVIEQNDSIKCSKSSTDFLKLQDKHLQVIFFEKLDSIMELQYPDNDQDSSIFFDLTPEYLDKFLNDIDSVSLSTKQEFEKEYHFNKAPVEFTDQEKCKDKIALSFDREDCSFSLNIYNSFQVEPDWCTESMVIYEFKINNGKISHFWRQVAG